MRNRRKSIRSMPLTVGRGPLPPNLRAQLRAQVEHEGEGPVRARVGLSRSSFARALAGLAVYPGTVAIIRQGMSA